MDTPEGGDFPDWEPLIIAVAPNGATKTRDDHPALPISPAEIAATAARCAAAGASMLHLHVRDPDAGHTLDADAYRAAIEAVRAAVGDQLLIQVSSEAAGRYAPEEQIRAMRALRPELVSLAVREIIPDPDHEEPAAEFLRWLIDERITPQFILYSAGEVSRYHELRQRGVIPAGAFPLLFVLGRYTSGEPSSPAALLTFLARHEAPAPWMVCAFGQRENACAAAAAVLGGHARVGFENNLYLKDGSRAEHNAQLVEQVRQASAAIGRRIADAQTARRILGVAPRTTQDRSSRA